jgi:hypothetical protein
MAGWVRDALSAKTGGSLKHGEGKVKRHNIVFISAPL